MRGYGWYDGAALRAIRAAYGVGRPVAMEVWRYDTSKNPIPPLPVEKPVPSPEVSLFVRITSMMASGMSQRATARALGIHLSKLQRTLAKGEPAAA